MKTFTGKPIRKLLALVLTLVLIAQITAPALAELSDTIDITIEQGEGAPGQPGADGNSTVKNGWQPTDGCDPDTYEWDTIFPVGCFVVQKPQYELNRGDSIKIVLMRLGGVNGRVELLAQLTPAVSEDGYAGMAATWDDIRLLDCDAGALFSVDDRSPELSGLNFTVVFEQDEQTKTIILEGLLGTEPTSDRMMTLTLLAADNENAEINPLGDTAVIVLHDTQEQEQEQSIVSFTAEYYLADRMDGYAEIRVTRTQGINFPFSAKLTITPGEGQPIIDYIDESYAALFRPGDTMIAVRIPLVQTTISSDEPGYGFTVSMTEPQGGVIEEPSVCTIQLINSYTPGDKVDVQLSSILNSPSFNDMTGSVILDENPVIELPPAVIEGRSEDAGPDQVHLSELIADKDELSGQAAENSESFNSQNNSIASFSAPFGLMATAASISTPGQNTPVTIGNLVKTNGTWKSKVDIVYDGINTDATEDRRFQPNNYIILSDRAEGTQGFYENVLVASKSEETRKAGGFSLVLDSRSLVGLAFPYWYEKYNTDGTRSGDYGIMRNGSAQVNRAALISDPILVGTKTGPGLYYKSAAISYSVDMATMLRPFIFLETTGCYAAFGFIKGYRANEMHFRSELTGTIPYTLGIKGIDFVHDYEPYSEFPKVKTSGSKEWINRSSAQSESATYTVPFDFDEHYLGGANRFYLGAKSIDGLNLLQVSRITMERQSVPVTVKLESPLLPGTYYLPENTYEMMRNPEISFVDGEGGLSDDRTGLFVGSTIKIKMDNKLPTGMYIKTARLCISPASGTSESVVTQYTPGTREINMTIIGDDDSMNKKLAAGAACEIVITYGHFAEVELNFTTLNATENPADTDFINNRARVFNALGYNYTVINWGLKAGSELNEKRGTTLDTTGVATKNTYLVDVENLQSVFVKGAVVSDLGISMLCKGIEYFAEDDTSQEVRLSIMKDETLLNLSKIVINFYTKESRGTKQEVSIQIVNRLLFDDKNSNNVFDLAGGELIAVLSRDQVLNDGIFREHDNANFKIEVEYALTPEKLSPADFDDQTRRYQLQPLYKSLKINETYSGADLGSLETSLSLLSAHRPVMCADENGSLGTLKKIPIFKRESSSGYLVFQVNSTLNTAIYERHQGVTGLYKVDRKNGGLIQYATGAAEVEKRLGAFGEYDTFDIAVYKDAVENGQNLFHAYMNSEVSHAPQLEFFNAEEMVLQPTNTDTFSMKGTRSSEISQMNKIPFLSQIMPNFTAGVKLENMPIKYYFSGDEMGFSAGYEFTSDGSALTGNSATPKESQNFFDRLKQPLTGLQKQLKEIPDKTAFGDSIAKMSKEFQFSIAINLSVGFKYDRDQQRWAVSNALMTAVGAGSASFKFRLAVCPVVYVFVNLGGEVAVAAGFKVVQTEGADGKQNNKLMFSGVTLTPELFAEAGGGIGVDLLRFEIYFRISATFNFIFGDVSSTSPNRLDSIKLDGSLGFFVQVLFFEFRQELFGLTYEYSYLEGHSFSTRWIGKSGSRSAGSQSSGLSLTERTYDTQDLSTVKGSSNADSDSGFSLFSINPQGIDDFDVPEGSGTNYYRLAAGIDKTQKYKIVSINDEPYIVFTADAGGSRSTVDRMGLFVKKLDIAQISSASYTLGGATLISGVIETGVLDFDVVSSSAGLEIVYTTYSNATSQTVVDAISGDEAMISFMLDVNTSVKVCYATFDGNTVTNHADVSGTDTVGVMETFPKIFATGTAVYISYVENIMPTSIDFGDAPVMSEPPEPGEKLDYSEFITEKMRQCTFGEKSTNAVVAYSLGGVPGAATSQVMDTLWEEGGAKITDTALYADGDGFVITYVGEQAVLDGMDILSLITLNTVTGTCATGSDFACTISNMPSVLQIARDYEDNALGLDGSYSSGNSTPDAKFDDPAFHKLDYKKINFGGGEKDYLIWNFNSALRYTDAAGLFAAGPYVIKTYTDPADDKGFIEAVAERDGAGNLYVLYSRGAEGMPGNLIGMNTDAADGEWGTGRTLAMHGLELFEKYERGGFDTKDDYLAAVDEMLMEKEKTVRFSNIETLVTGGKVYVLANGTVTPVDKGDDENPRYLVAEVTNNLYLIVFELKTGEMLGQGSLHTDSDILVSGNVVTPYISFKNTGDKKIGAGATVSLFCGNSYGSVDLLGSWVVNEAILSGQTVKINQYLSDEELRTEATRIMLPENLTGKRLYFTVKNSGGTQIYSSFNVDDGFIYLDTSKAELFFNNIMVSSLDVVNDGTADYVPINITVELGNAGYVPAPVILSFEYYDSSASGGTGAWKTMYAKHRALTNSLISFTYIIESLAAGEMRTVVMYNNEDIEMGVDGKPKLTTDGQLIALTANDLYIPKAYFDSDSGTLRLRVTISTVGPEEYDTDNNSTEFLLSPSMHYIAPSIVDLNLNTPEVVEFSLMTTMQGLDSTQVKAVEIPINGENLLGVLSVTQGATRKLNITAAKKGATIVRLSTAGSNTYHDIAVNISTVKQNFTLSNPAYGNLAPESWELETSYTQYPNAYENDVLKVIGTESRTITFEPGYLALIDLWGVGEIICTIEEVNRPGTGVPSTYELNGFNTERTFVADGLRNVIVTLTVPPGTLLDAFLVEYVVDYAIYVDGVSLNQTTLNLTVGGSSAQLTATVRPSDASNQTVSWSTSNASIANVSQSGYVTPISAGSCTIRVTTEDGSFTAACTVTVQPASILPEPIDPEPTDPDPDPDPPNPDPPNPPSINLETTIMINGVVIPYTISDGIVTLKPTAEQIKQIINASKDGNVVIDLSVITGVTVTGAILEANPSWFGIPEFSALTLIVKNTGNVLLKANVLAVLAKLNAVLQFKLTKGSLAFDVVTVPDGVSIGYNDPANPLYLFIPVTVESGTSANGYAAVKKTESGYDVIPYGIYYNGEIIFQTAETGVFDVIYNAKTFSDTAGHWATSEITFVSARGLFQGVGDDLFAPDTPMTRAMFAVVLTNIEKADLSAYKTSRFTDVPPGSWYCSAVEWAADAGIVNGYGGGLFGPEDKISREQMALMLMNYIKYKGYSLPGGEKTVFADNAQIASWAIDAVEKMQAAGIINGRPGNIFDPKGNATRAEVAAIFTKFITTYVKYAIDVTSTEVDVTGQAAAGSSLSGDSKAASSGITDKYFDKSTMDALQRSLRMNPEDVNAENEPE